MPDIAMCKGEGCGLRGTCYRFLAKPSRRQSYMAAPVIGGDVCDYYVEAKAKSQIRRLDSQAGRWTEKIKFTP